MPDSRTRHRYSIFENVNPTFLRLYQDPAVYKFLSGGRFSQKSKTVAQWLAIGMMKHIAKGRRVNVVCLRQVKDVLVSSCFGDIVWALQKLNVLQEFKVTPTALRITHRKTKSQFHFFGMANKDKVKSTNVGDVVGVWFEEAAEMLGTSARPAWRRPCP